MKEVTELYNLKLLELMSGYRITQALYVVAKLGVADLLREKPKSSDTLAKELNLNSENLYRIMRALTSLNVFKESENKDFSLTPLSQLLRSDRKDSLRYLVIFQGEEPYEAFGNLLNSLESEIPAFEQKFGMSHFEYLGMNSNASNIFNRAMAGAQHAAGNPFELYDFGNAKIVIDVGGGKGTLISSILKTHTHLQGILFDLPEAVEDTPTVLTENEITERCKIETGSAFESIPPGGDIYILSRVLHDWSDEKAVVILRNCRKVIKETGVLLIREAILPEGFLPSPRTQLDLMMFVMTGGKERTEDQWKDLLEKGGFYINRTWKTNTNHDLIEAKPILEKI